MQQAIASNLKYAETRGNKERLHILYAIGDRSKNEENLEEMDRGRTGGRMNNLLYE